MIYQLLALSLCWQAARACVPVRPGEDMPCPTFPKATAATGWFLKGIVGPTVENGAMVYTCAGTDSLLEVDGATVMPLDLGAKISCKANSGQFTKDDGSVVGSKKYVCGEMLVPCPAFPEARMIDMVDEVKKPTMSTSNGDEVWTCMAPSKLYKVAGGNPANGVPLATGTTLVCKAQDGAFTEIDAQGTESPADPADTYACGTLGCQTCDMGVFKDKTIPNCGTQTEIFCTSKPTTMEVMMCPVASCTDAADSLNIILTGTTKETINPATNLKCNNGVWENNGAALPANSEIVCSKSADCAATCDVSVTKFYDMGVDIGMITGANTMKMLPFCNYKCPPNSNMLVGTTSHESLQCDMQLTDSVKTEDGMALSETMKFSCIMCNCNGGDLNAGDQGACPPNTLCAKPTSNNQCMAVCPPGSTAAYVDMNGEQKKGAATAKCAGTDWIEVGSNPNAGVTCAYDDGKGQLPTKPNSPACPELDHFTTADCIAQGGAGITTCDPNQLIYFTSGDGYGVTCKSGSLVTDMSMLDDTMYLSCAASGMWERNAAFASCVTDDSQVQTCKDSLADMSTENVEHKCELGSCYLTCPGTQQFEDPAAPGVKYKSLKCFAGGISDAAFQIFPDPTTVKCVA